MGSHAHLQGIFLTQGSNLHLLHYRQFLYCWATREALCILITQYNFTVWKSRTSNQGNRNLANKKKWNQRWSWYLRIFKLHISSLLIKPPVSPPSSSVSADNYALHWDKQSEENIYKLPLPNLHTYQHPYPYTLTTIPSLTTIIQVYALTRNNIIPCSLDPIPSHLLKSTAPTILSSPFKLSIFLLYWNIPISKQIYSSIYQLKTNCPQPTSSNYSSKTPWMSYLNSLSLIPGLPFTLNHPLSNRDTNTALFKSLKISVL